MQTIDLKLSAIKVDDRTSYQESGMPCSAYQAWWPENHPAMIDGTIKGCPLGRGHSHDSAVADLVRRVESESGVTVRLIIL
jgi:hypothetical protein